MTRYIDFSNLEFLRFYIRASWGFKEGGLEKELRRRNLEWVVEKFPPSKQDAMNQLETILGERARKEVWLREEIERLRAKVSQAKTPEMTFIYVKELNRFLVQYLEETRDYRRDE